MSVDGNLLAPGAEVDGFLVGEILHQGGMAVIYAVRRDADDQALVMKVPRMAFGSHPACYAFFEAEQMILSTLTGTHVPRLVAKGDRMRRELPRIAAEAGVPMQVTGASAADGVASSLVFAHPVKEGAERPTSPDDLVAAAHPWISERLLKSTLLLEDVSTRSGLGAISLAHGDEDLTRTLEGYRAALDRLRKAGLA